VTRSIRTRVVVGVGAGVAVAFALAAVVVDALARDALYAQLDAALVDEARHLAVLVEQEGDAIDTDLTPQTLGGDRARFFQLWAGGGGLRSAALGAHQLVPAQLAAPGAATGAITLPDGAPGRQATLAFHPRMEADDAAAPVLAVLAVARGTGEVEDTIGRLRTVLALGGALGLVLCIGALLAAARYALAPVGRVARAIAAIDPSGPGRAAPRFAVAGAPVELAPIVDRIDDLLARLAAVLARERELTAEVAHELRTPLAGLRSTIELALAREREPDRYRAALADCLAIVEQTHRMVEALLALARLDAGAVAIAHETVELAPLVDDVVGAAMPRAAARDLAIERAIATDLRVVTDPTRLRVVVANLVDNAVSHADAGGRIRIELARGATGATLRIANTGSTIGPEAAARVFERFWRGDAARTAGPHTGLGLALCKKLVELLGGTIAVTAEAGGEFAVTVTVPAGPAARSGA
jgi:two-component system OmpR family sensor kinase